MDTQTQIVADMLNDAMECEFAGLVRGSIFATCLRRHAHRLANVQPTTMRPMSSQFNHHVRDLRSFADGFRFTRGEDGSADVYLLVTRLEFLGVYRVTSDLAVGDQLIEIERLRVAVLAATAHSPQSGSNES